MADGSFSLINHSKFNIMKQPLQFHHWNFIESMYSEKYKPIEDYIQKHLKNVNSNELITVKGIGGKRIDGNNHVSYKEVIYTDQNGNECSIQINVYEKLVIIPGSHPSKKITIRKAA